MPLGDFGDLFQTGFGGTANVSYALSSNFEIGITTGYFTWQFDNSYINDQIQSTLGDDAPSVDLDIPFSTVPVLASVKYYFSRGTIKPYLVGELGLHLTNFTLTGSVKEDPNTQAVSVPQQSKSESKGGFGVGFGIKYNLSEKVDLDLNGKFNSISVEFKQSNTKTTYTDGGYTTTTTSSSSSAMYFSINAGVSFAL